jgi:hypothetical protein
MTILAYIAMSQDVLEEGRSKQRLYVSFRTFTQRAFIAPLYLAVSGQLPLMPPPPLPLPCFRQPLEACTRRQRPSYYSR